MKTKIFILATLMFLLAIIILISNFTFEFEKQEILFEKQNKRSSITFLLGEDKAGYRYFELAEEHFLYDSTEKTQHMVKSCRSIEDLIMYLNHYNGDHKWGSIQVVLHGNPFNGLSLPINDIKERASSKNLIKAIVDNTLPKLNSTLIDTSTKINFWGCGIGKNPFIKIALEKFFTLPYGKVPKIYVSPHFVIFNEMPGEIPAKRLNASYWPYIFKRGYRPGNLEIARALKDDFPNVEIDWINSLGQGETSMASGAFENSFHIGVSWIVEYPSKEDRPTICTMEEKLAWIHTQPELMAQIEEVDIPIEKFTWTVNKIIHRDEKGQKVSAIKAIGMATVLCVLDTNS